MTNSKMDLVSLFNQAVSFKRNIKIRDLKVGESYFVKRLAIAEHLPHGTALVATIIMGMRDSPCDLDSVEEVDVILPRRILNYVDFQKIQEYNANPNAMLHFAGQDGNHYKISFIYAFK